jgi:hypothetical protein
LAASCHAQSDGKVGFPGAGRAEEHYVAGFGEVAAGGGPVQRGPVGGGLVVEVELGHQVCDRGSYSVVRHPGYSLTILGAFAIAMVFGPPAFWVAAAIAVTLVLRTACEDKALQAGLPGYAGYARRVKYRLVPLVW